MMIADVSKVQVSGERLRCGGCWRWVHRLRAVVGGELRSLRADRRLGG